MSTRYQTELKPNRHLQDPEDRGSSLVARAFKIGVGGAAAFGALRYGIRYAAREGYLEQAGRHISAALRAGRAVTREGVTDPYALRRIYREGLDQLRVEYEIDRLVRERNALIRQLERMRSEGQSIAHAERAIDEALIRRLQDRSATSRFIRADHVTVQEIGIDRLSLETRQWLETLPENVRQSLRVDSAVLRGSYGDIIDLRQWREISDRTGEWWSRTLLGGVLHLRDIIETRRAPLGVILREGTIHPTLSPDKLGSPLLVVGGRAIDPFTGRVVREGLDIIPGRYSTQARILSTMAGVGYPDRPVTAAGRIASWAGLDRFLDIGYQRGADFWANIKAWFGKFNDPNWTRNMVLEAMRPGAQVTDEQIRRIGSLIQHRTPVFSREVFESLEHLLPEQFRGLSFLTPEEALESLRRVASRPGASAEIQSLLQVIEDDISAFFRRRRIHPVRVPLLGYVDIITPEEQIQRAISIEAARSVDREQLLNAIRSQINFGRLTRQDLSTAEDILMAADWMVMVGRTGTAPLDDIQRAGAQTLLQSDSDVAKNFRQRLERLAKREAPLYEIGPLEEWALEDELFALSSEYTVVSKSQIGEKFANIRGINDFISAMAQVGRELRAGRHNMESVTRVTMVPYYAMLRLSNILEPFGLGLSHRSGASAWELAKGIFLKRGLAIYGAVQAAAYLDYLVGDITGRSLRHRYYDMIVGARLDMAEAQDELGITEWRKRRRELSGVFWDPLSELPVIGWIFTEPMSRDELVDYYRWGRQPIRRGRYWGLGNAPFIGQDVQYYLPNEYILGTTDWKMTETVYGSHEEYWSRRWFPTPSHPYAPIKFLLDPYWLEEMHYDTRPYPMTGQLVSPEIPFAPLINATLGNLIKPVRPMHEETLRQINESIAEMRYTSNVLTVSGIERRGRIIPVHAPPVPDAPDVVFYDEEGFDGDVGWAVPGGIAVLPGGARSTGLPIGAAVLSGGSRMTAEHLSAINKDIRAAAQLRFQVEYGRRPFDPLSPPEEMPLSPKSLVYNWAQMEYSMREIMGIYGWGAEVIAGSEPIERRLVVATADRMAGMQRGFWHSEMGGFGGGFSEFWRRMLPHPQRVKLWNPIPNQMPDWLPGEDYFINFRQGDPYSAGGLKNLELRLPGAAYEATHTLFADPWFGEYGALTRFMILADVAPYSEEYRLYEKTVRMMFREGLLPEEWKPIFQRTLEETRRQKRRYEFSEYRFKDVLQKIERRTVTVTRIIDSSTFLTAEFPENPIRLAAVRLNQELPISAFIRPGMQVEIAYNVHEAERYADDMLKTIRATVFINGQNLNYELLQAGIGRQTSEEHPAAIVARYTPSEIASGQFWEFLAHLNVPILHRKLMPVDSALEYYERKRVYGREWQPWEKPWSGILHPTYRSYATRDPLTAGFLGAITGGIIGQMFFGGGGRTKGGALIGGNGAMFLSLIRAGTELVTGKTYIPRDRQLEREINEYFDVLEYVKYRGLYEYAARMARTREFINIDHIMNQVKERQKRRSREIKKLEERKRRLILRGESPRSEAIQEINRRIQEIQSRDRLDGIKLGPWAQAAVYYRARYESTLYGLDLENPDYQMIFRALPSQDREFFQVFIEEADPKKRERILELVPENQRRIYERIWYGKVIDPPSLEEFFSKYALPTPDWVGWRADVELDWVKARVAEEEGVELPEVGVWFDDLEDAIALGIEPIDIRADGPLGEDLRKRIETILRGRGFRNVQVLLGPSIHPGIHVNIDVSEDPRQRIGKAIRSGIWL